MIAFEDLKLQTTGAYTITIMTASSAAVYTLGDGFLSTGVQTTAIALLIGSHDLAYFGSITITLNASGDTVSITGTGGKSGSTVVTF